MDSLKRVYNQNHVWLNELLQCDVRSELTTLIKLNLSPVFNNQNLKNKQTNNKKNKKKKQILDKRRIVSVSWHLTKELIDWELNQYFNNQLQLHDIPSHWFPLYQSINQSGNWSVKVIRHRHKNIVEKQMEEKSWKETDRKYLVII